MPTPPRRGTLALLLWLVLAGAGPVRAEGPAGNITGQVVAADATGPIIVYLAEVPRARPPAPPAPPPAPRLRVEQRGRQFVPPFLVVRQGQFLEFVNRDHGYHSVFSLSPGNEFDLGLAQEGPPRAVEMRAPGEVEVYCDLHPEMSARILVLQNDHQAQVSPGGIYVLREVPPGSYTVVTWSPWHQTERRRVRVYDGGTSQADFALRPRKSPETHLDRHGGS